MVFSEPFLPKDDELILTTLTENFENNELKIIKSLKVALNADPKNQHLAYELANAYAEIARNQNDPRFYGLAEAVIKPWWFDGNDYSLIMLKVRILQFNHQFSEAIQVLNKMLQYHSDPQALLIRASINQVLGKYDEVKSDCSKLAREANSLVISACFFSVNGFTSSAKETKKYILNLKNIINQSSDESVDVKIWAIGLAAESASLTHDWITAEELMLQGLRIKYDDDYLLSLYADLLLKQKRYRECIDLLKPYSNQTSLLIRLLVAKNKLFVTKIQSQKQKELDLRIREDFIKRDQRHLREYAYYQLYVKKQYQSALQNALINWESQKEMNDALILYGAAYHAQRDDVLEMIDEWAKKTQIKIDFSTESLKI